MGGGVQLTSALVLKLIFNVQVVAAKLEEEQAAETKILQDDQKEEPNQDSYEEKQDDSSKNGTENLKENQTLPNGEVPQDEDEGVDLRGSVHLKKIIDLIYYVFYSWVSGFVPNRLIAQLKQDHRYVRF